MTDKVEVSGAYSPETNTHYDTWDDLVRAEANGWAVVGIVDRKHTAPVVVGPFDTQAEAQKAQARLRAKWVRQERRDHMSDARVRVFVRILWKDYR